MSYQLRGVFLPDERERDAWVVNGRITFERPSSGSRSETLATRGWIIPGLVDAHCHVGIAPRGHVTELDEQVIQARQNRDAGALLLRDVGSPVDNSYVQSRDDLPRLIRAGQHIARTGRYIRDQAIEVEPATLVEEVARQSHAGDGWIKIVVDGIDREQGEMTPTFPPEALAAAVARAHELGARVAAHVFCEQALEDAVTAGVDSLEHATGLTESMLDRVRDAGCAIVPTLINIDHFHAIALQADRKFPRYAAHMRALFATSRQRIRAAFEHGIPIFTGTDAGGTLPHGLIRSEISALVGAGLPLAELMAQASWRGREWLGVQGLTEGAPADLIVYDDDPRIDLTVIYQPRRILLRGHVVA